jgi:hypothetical protein
MTATPAAKCHRSDSLAQKTLLLLYAAVEARRPYWGYAPRDLSKASTPAPRR